MRHAVKPAFALLLVLALLVSSAFTVTAEAEAPYDELRKKWKDVLTGGTLYDPAIPEIAAKIGQIEETAIGYRDSLQRGTDRIDCNCLWTASSSELSARSYIFRSYDRIKAMALAYATHGSSLQYDDALKTDIIEALDWLNTNRFHSAKPGPGTSQWWFIEIGSPLRLGEIMVMMYDDLSPEQIAAWTAAIDYNSPLSYSSVEEYKYMAANRVWRAIVHALRGITGESSDKMIQARDGLSDVTDGRNGRFNVFEYATGGDGFYPDGSFIQHGIFAYNGGYGNSLLKDLSDVMYLLKGTPWEVTDPKSANVWKWVYDSFEPLLYKTGLMMDMVRGREVSRYNFQDSVAGHKATASIIRLSQIAPEADAARFKSLVKYLVGNDSGFYIDASIEMNWRAGEIVKDRAIPSRGDLFYNKVFSRMARAVHVRPGFGFGISMFSDKIANFENNFELRKGWYTGSGMTYIYTEDKEQYSDNFWATVNYNRLPGTTVDTKPRTVNVNESVHVNSDNRVGGVSDGKFGVVGMGLTAPGASGTSLKGKKSWFLFDDEVVSLGSDIRLDDQEAYTVETIVDNRKLNAAGDNALTVNGKAKLPSLGSEETMNKVSWAHLAGNVPKSDIGYYFPGGQTAVKGSRLARTAKWGDLNVNQRPSPDNPITRHYLTLWLDHGISPSNAAYQYVTLPNRTAKQTADYASKPDIRIVANSPDVHAVKEKRLGITGAFFWNNEKTTAGGITSNQVASVMVEEKDRVLTVSAADPTRANNGTIEIELDKKAIAVISADPGITVTETAPTIRFTVHAADSEGKTFQVKFRLSK
ncbi:polysaccharide lyase 8 family protein [Paenibacillus arenilitoris]|uniref:Polysaccharide lyase 8 family protein n=1 Tax=Paenibacillus arenilitoris TaxID=2772299 RepID=A0A927H424_9BACL|nr:polysaccharide lyase 8 family protein [Paenibacillus arenilitoris]MBD2867018.1 polysaccharide lyase 8 family protein [Paenibacillus arenilitoris]